MTLPLDSDGFLRRQCPACGREFKWRPTPTTGEAVAEPPAPPAHAYFCPYCFQPAPPDSWWTDRQVEHAKQVALAEALGPQLRRFKSEVEGMNRPGGLVNFSLNLPPMGRPEPLSEPDDMARVDYPCHPEDPIKIDAAWEDEVGCLVCGIHYPIHLLRPLADGGAQ